MSTQPTGDPICRNCGKYKTQCLCQNYLTASNPVPSPLLSEINFNQLHAPENDKGKWFEFEVETEDKDMKELGVPSGDVSKVIINLNDVVSWWENEGEGGNLLTAIDTCYYETRYIIYPYDAFTKLMLNHRGIDASKPPTA